MEKKQLLRENEQISMLISDCRSDEDCPYTRACIQNHCLDPCYTREYPEKQNCTTCFPQSHSPACEGGCFVRNHRPICEGKLIL